MLYTLVSSLNEEAHEFPFQISDSFVEEHQVVAILSGGTEAMFVDLVRSKKIDLQRLQQLARCCARDPQFHPSAQRYR